MQPVDTPTNAAPQLPPAGSVTFCITELDPGGAEKALVRFAIGLQALGWRVNVVSLRDEGELAIPLKDNKIDVTSLNCGSLADVRAVPRLINVLKQHHPDCVVCFLHQANIVGRLAGWFAGIGSVVSGVRVADRRKLVIWTDWLTKSLTCSYLAVSRQVAESHSRLCGVPPEKFHVLHNGVDLPSAPNDRRPVNGLPLRLLFVGRLTGQKRPVDIVHAVDGLPAALKEQTTVDFLGDGELSSVLQQAIRQTGQQNRLKLHGVQDDVPAWMDRSDVLVLPSAWEGLPNVVLEAMAHHLPVISAAVDGVLDVLEDRRTGQLYESGNVEQLRDTLQATHAGPEALREMAVRAFDDVRQRFCWQTSIAQLDGLLRDLRTPAAGK